MRRRLLRVGAGARPRSARRPLRCRCWSMPRVGRRPATRRRCRAGRRARGACVGRAVTGCSRKRSPARRRRRADVDRSGRRRRAPLAMLRCTPSRRRVSRYWPALAGSARSSYSLACSWLASVTVSADRSDEVAGGVAARCWSPAAPRGAPTANSGAPLPGGVRRSRPSACCAFRRRPAPRPAGRAGCARSPRSSF